MPQSGFVKTKEDIIKNVFYLRRNIGDSRVRDLIKRGRNFVVVRDRDGDLSFGPSRFVGFISNELGRHEREKSETRDGRDTDDEIGDALKTVRGRRKLGGLHKVRSKAETSQKLEASFPAFCAKMA